jgi:hypothetical protein
MQEVGTIKGAAAAWVSNYYLSQNTAHTLRQWFSTFVRPRPGKFLLHKTRARYRATALHKCWETLLYGGCASSMSLPSSGVILLYSVPVPLLYISGQCVLNSRYVCFRPFLTCPPLHPSPPRFMTPQVSWLESVLVSCNLSRILDVLVSLLTNLALLCTFCFLETWHFELAIHYENSRK